LQTAADPDHTHITLVTDSKDRLCRQQREIESAAAEARRHLLAEEGRINALRDEVERGLELRQGAAAAAEAGLQERARAAEGGARVAGCDRQWRAVTTYYTTDPQ
jgi:hypothetical protein